MSAVSAAIAAHRAARVAFCATTGPADEIAVAQAGGDTSDEAMAPARAAAAAAEAAEQDAWHRLLAARPASLAELGELVRYVAGSPALYDFEDHAGLLVGIADAAEALAGRMDRQGCARGAPVRGDLLHGSRAIADHLGVPKGVAKHLVRVGAIPWFPLAGVACARKSTLALHFAALEADDRQLDGLTGAT